MKNALGLNYWVLGGFEAEATAFEAIDYSAKWGLDCVELTFGDLLTKQTTKQECQQILDYARQKNIALKSLSTGAYWNCSLGSGDEDERQKAIEFTKSYIQVASYLEVPTILVVPGAVDVAWDEERAVTSYQKVWDNSTKSLKQLLPFAKQHKVKIALENVWNKFLLSPIEWKFYLEQFESEDIGIYLDAGNVLINGYPEHWVEILDKHIFALQIKNFQRSDCGGALTGFTDDLTSGDLNFDALKKALEKINYQGIIIAEMIPFCRLPELNIPDLALAKDTAQKMIDIFCD